MVTEEEGRRNKEEEKGRRGGRGRGGEEERVFSKSAAMGSDRQFTAKRAHES